MAGPMSKFGIVRKLAPLLSFIIVYIVLYGWMFGYRINLQVSTSPHLVVPVVPLEYMITTAHMSGWVGQEVEL